MEGRMGVMESMRHTYVPSFLLGLVVGMGEREWGAGVEGKRLLKSREMGKGKKGISEAEAEEQEEWGGGGREM